MTTCLLVRHGQSQANVDGLLAGHIDTGLTESGMAQVKRLAASLAPVPISLVVTSPLRRCRTTAEELAAGRPGDAPVRVEDRFVEVRYGGWTGRALKELAQEELWGLVQSRPSAVSFPADPVHASESMTAMAERAWSAWLDWERTVVDSHSERAVWVVVSHGDVIKAMLAKALGLELDQFQSIIVDPASVSLVHRFGDRISVGAMNVRDDLMARLAEQGATRTGAPTGAGTVGGGDA